MPDVVIFKIGGSLIDDESGLNEFLTGFAKLPYKKILVHGGGILANQLCQTLKIPVNMVDGRRVTDHATLEVVTMVYGGLINKRLVASLQAKDCPAIGLTGADGGLMEAHRRQAETGPDYGFVGDIDHVNDALLESFLETGLTPVIAPLSCTKNGQLLNTNADTIASRVGQALAPKMSTSLYFVMDLPGVLRTSSQPDSVIPQLDQAAAQQLADDGTVTRGMLPKLDNGFAAKSAGAHSVRIANARGSLKSCLESKGYGTELI
jgi:acetylglutamate kinase